jgi:SnoaL-like domain
VTSRSTRSSGPRCALDANQVATDYTSLFGGEPQSQAGDALIDGWRTHLATVVTQHLLGPIDAEIAGEQARARCHVRALHYAAAPPVATPGRCWATTC